MKKLNISTVEEFVDEILETHDSDFFCREAIEAGPISDEDIRSNVQLKAEEEGVSDFFFKHDVEILKKAREIEQETRLAIDESKREMI